MPRSLSDNYIYIKQQGKCNYYTSIEAVIDPLHHTMSTPTLETNLDIDTVTNELYADTIAQPDDIHTAITPNDITPPDSHAAESEPHTHMDSKADNVKQETNYESHNTCSDVTQARDVPDEDTCKNMPYLS